MSWRATALTLLLLSGCDSSQLEQSCGGAEVALCGPREWAEITNASVSPEGLTIADFSMRAQIRVDLDRCSDAPAPHDIELSVLVGAMDGGRPAGLTSLLSVADGEDGDMNPDDGVIDVEVANPFIATVPANTDVTLRFVARSRRAGGCTSGVFEQAYRTGPPRP